MKDPSAASAAPQGPANARALFLSDCFTLLDFVISTWAYLLTYLIIGGVVICWLEADSDLRLKEEQLLKVQQVNLTEDQWEALRLAGIYERPSIEDLETVWTLSNGVFLLLTAVTTIGYGKHTPRTPAGMLFTCLYSIGGIGFVATITLRTAEGCIRCLRALLDDHQQKAQLEVAARAALQFRHVDRDRRGVLGKPQLAELLRALAHGQPPSEDLVEAVYGAAAAPEDGGITEATFPLAVAAYYAETKGDPEGSQRTVLTIAISLFLCIWLGGATVFMGLEGWTFVEALWFGYATITTIGFGDYAPETALGQAFAYLYIIGGLGMAALVISATSDMVEARQKRLDSSVRQRLAPALRRIQVAGQGFLPAAAQKWFKGKKDAKIS